MVPVSVELAQLQDVSDPSLPFARSYQLEALEKAMKHNTIVYLETGSGKTLIAIMLLRSFAHLLRRPAHSHIAVFLVPTVVLVTQQADVIETHTDLKVGKYWGDMGVDFWDAASWNKQLEEHEVLVMTPKILQDALSHTYIKLDMIRVLIFDECHNARGNHPYASIMRDFYHRHLLTDKLPRIFGMTASPVKSKAKDGEKCSYWKDISELEDLMNSKVYTCRSEAVLAEHISFPNSKVQFYDVDAPDSLQNHLIESVNMLRDKHICSLKTLGLEDSVEQSLCSKMKKLSSRFQFCLRELGLWAAVKASEVMTLEQADEFSWDALDVHCRTSVKSFISDVHKQFSAYIPSGFSWSISNVKAYMGPRLLSSKVICLIEALLGYRQLKDLRCIIFVERVISAIVVRAILDELLFQANGWRVVYIAGHHCAVKCQSRKEQNKIVEEFRKGSANIIVATSVLEEGLDVQSCNLVVRFDPTFSVCSFIQSRGRARMQNSDFVLMVKRGDDSELSRVRDYLSSGNIMRKESLSHASLPCQPVGFDEFEEIFYKVPSTGAIVTLHSSVSLIYFYCSRLPSDGYFKPSPRCDIDEDSGTCTIQFPNNCPIPSVSTKVDRKLNQKMLKRFACFEACKKLHEIGALTDNLVPDIVMEEGLVQELEHEPYNEDQPKYIAPEFISHGVNDPSSVYHCYLMELKQDFFSDIPVHDIVLVLKYELDTDVGSTNFNMEVDWGNMSVNMKYCGTMSLTNEMVVLCRQFQVAVLRVLMHRNFNKLQKPLGGLFDWRNEDLHGSHLDYLLLPCHWLPRRSTVDWESICSVSFLQNEIDAAFKGRENHKRLNSDSVYTKNGYVHSSVLESCLVCTPHNGYIYCVTGILDGMTGNSLLTLSDGEAVTYTNYYKKQHGIELAFDEQALLRGRQMFKLQNHLLRCRQKREKESSEAYVELPPEVCLVLMSPVSVATLYSFSFVPSIMHRVESLLLSANLRRTILDFRVQNVFIPVTKVLEAVTTKQCEEGFHLESLETLGDSFLKYAVCQQLFKNFQNSHEGLLSIRKDRIVSNVALCKLGCQRKIPGFICDESFDPKNWSIPGDPAGKNVLEEEVLSSGRKIYNTGIRKINFKRVADVVEALIGAFLSAGGEKAAIIFMNWLGIEAELSYLPYQRDFHVNPNVHVNISHLESLLNYSFRDPSLLVEALTHGSYMLPEIQRCYQRLEFLGDCVLDHLVTVYLYARYPGMTPGLLTDLRSASVNNECYALSAVRAGLYKHILHASQVLYRQMEATVAQFEQLSTKSTFGWELDINFPKVLADIIESLAGAVFVDSGYKKEAVFDSIVPLIEPLVTPETLKHHPVKELQELCQKHNFSLGKLLRSSENGVPCITMEVEANGLTHKHVTTEKDKTMAKKIASRALLKKLKESIGDL